MDTYGCVIARGDKGGILFSDEDGRGILLDQR